MIRKWDGVGERSLMGGGEPLFLCLNFTFDMSNIFHIQIIWYICRQNRIFMAKVIHVHLTYGKRGERRDWYFSSISAVYTVLTAEQIGAKKSYLLHAGLSGNGTVMTKKAIIKQSTLISGSRSGVGSE